MSENPVTRVSLILRLRNSVDAAAWNEFVEIYQPLIIRLAQKKGLQPADASDLSQEVLTRVAKAINRWNPDPAKGTFRGWISQITRNLVVDFMRKSGRQPWTADSTDVFEMIQSKCDPSLESQWFDLERERQIFAWAAEKVRPSFAHKTWQAFWSTAVDAKPVSEVARSLAMSNGAIYIAKSRVMARLKSVIEKTEHRGQLGDEDAKNVKDSAGPFNADGERS